MRLYRVKQLGEQNILVGNKRESSRSYANQMSFIHGTVGVSHPSRPELQGFEVSALADSGAVHLCIPEHIANQLQLREL